MYPRDPAQEVLEQIRAGRVSKRARLFFVLRSGAAAVVALAALVFCALTLSFITFSVRQGGTWLLLGFGQAGLLTFAALFPWAELALSLLLLVALQALLREFRFGYRVPIVRAFLVLALMATIGAGFVALTPLHASLLARADADALPLLGPWYEALHDSHEAQGVFRGVVQSIAEQSFVITGNDKDRDTDDRTRTVVPPPGFSLRSLAEGARVYVAGALDEQGVVHAYGVAPLSDF